jgi:hypothetical protein
MYVEDQPIFEQIKLKDILLWITDNSEDVDAMDKINKTVYPHTSRYISSGKY